MQGVVDVDPGFPPVGEHHERIVAVGPHDLASEAGRELTALVVTQLNRIQAHLLERPHETQSLCHENPGSGWEGPQGWRMEMVVMAVGDIQVVDRTRVDGLEKGSRIQPPLCPEAGTLPPRVRQDADPSGLDEQTGVTYQGRSHGLTILGLARASK